MSNHKTQKRGRESLPTNADVAWTLGELTVAQATGAGPLEKKARGVWVKTAGTFNFIDGDDVEQSLDSGYFQDKAQYGIEIKEVLAGTTLVARPIY